MLWVIFNLELPTLPSHFLWDLLDHLCGHVVGAPDDLLVHLRELIEHNRGVPHVHLVSKRIAYAGQGVQPTIRARPRGVDHACSGFDQLLPADLVRVWDFAPRAENPILGSTYGKRRVHSVTQSKNSSVSWAIVSTFAGAGGARRIDPKKQSAATVSWANLSMILGTFGIAKSLEIPS